jgi:hypothetical protein
MLKLLLTAALTCGSGERLADLHDKLPQNLRFIDVVISVAPAYTRLYIYQLGHPRDFLQCCSNKPTGVLRVPVGSGRFCLRQSQPQMKWTAKLLLRPDVEM